MRLDRFYISKHMCNHIKTVSFHNAAQAFSDDSLVYLKISQSNVKNRTPVWCMNTSILGDKGYYKLISDFWPIWQAKRSFFHNIQTWWDIGKHKIKLLTQQYCHIKHNEFKQAKSSLENEIQLIENNLDTNTPLPQMYTDKKEALTRFTVHEMKGAATRARHNFLNESDIGNSFFFNLEKRNSVKKTILHLKRPDESLTENPEEIRKIAHDFYAHLYTPEITDDVAQDTLLEGLPQIRYEDRDTLDEIITLDELNKTVKLLAHGRTPGIDGIPNEFYQKFWHIIGGDLCEVLSCAISDGILPLSCTRAVVTLLPKRGDLTKLKNWRPVSLLCSDYKILTKTLSLRLRSVIGSVVHPDQSCSIPNRHIHDNINLLRDAIDFSNFTNSPLAIVALDQEKAFDRIHHTYLYKTLQAFGFGTRFLSYIRLIYTNAQSLIRINSALTSPFTCGRGIRQGCSLSSQLYVLAIEPLLDKIRTEKNIQGITIPNSKPDDQQCKLTAYADDVEFFITRHQDFEKLTHWLNVYERASNSRINLGKSEGLWVGSWRNCTTSPLGIKWNNKGLKLLGVYLGNDKSFTDQNWTTLVQKVENKLAFWSRFAPSMSYRGRSLVINNLVSSQLLYCFNGIPPLVGDVKYIQSLMVNFFWQGRHWVPAETLYLPMENGGQNITHLASRVTAMRLGYLQRLLYSDYNHASFRFTDYFFSQADSLARDRNILCININSSLRHLPKFYCDLLQEWNLLSKVRKINEDNHTDILNEPLFNNPLVCHPLRNEPFVFSQFATAGITQICDLIDISNKTWHSSSYFRNKVNIHSDRILQITLKVIHDSIPTKWKKTINTYLKNDPTNAPPSHLNVQLHFSDELNIPLYKIEKGALYKYLVKVLYNSRHPQRLDTVWRDILSLPKEVKPHFCDCYREPITKLEGDLQWRIAHGAFATGRFLFKAKFANSAQCPFCEEVDTLQHIFFDCHSMHALAGHVKVIMNKLVEPGFLMPPWWLVILPPRRSCHFNSRQAQTIFVYIICITKLAIHISRRNKRDDHGSTAPLDIFKNYIQARLKAEFEYFRLTNQVQVFEDKWAVDDALCRIENNDLLILV